MKLKLLLFLILMIAFRTYSQEDQTNKDLPLYNLFYLSKYITSDKLSSEQVIQIYSTLTNIVSADTNKIASLKVRIGKNPITEFLNNKKLKEQQMKEEIIRDLKTGFLNRFVVQKDHEIWDKKFKKFSDEEKEESKLLEKKMTFEKLKKAIEDKDSIQVKTLKNELTLKNEILKTTQTNDSIFLIKAKIAEIESGIAKNLVKKEEYYQEVIKFADDYISRIGTTTGYTIKYFDNNNIKHANTEIHLNSIIHSAEQRAATNSLSIPSEADMINAMAIFLAKRAQQETAIWFMDQLRKNLNNPLIYDAFPETIKLIESLEDYKTPNFSVAWRYAISSDFVKMPKNLAKSSWIKNVVFDHDAEKAAMFETSVVFGYDLNRLIAEKYSYRDIIRHFYTNPSLNYADASIDPLKRNKAQEQINKSITILYILTNEFFAVDKYEGKENFRLLSYEEITTLNEQQWLALVQLIELKYGAKFTENSSFFKDTFAEIKNKEGLSKWIGNLLISLSQFDKVNKDFQKALENKNESSGNTFYNVWQITSQIIENIDYKKYLSKTSPSNEFDITLLKESLAIYDNFQSKNYTTGIRKTIDIIQRISTNEKDFNYVFLLKNIEIVFKKDTISFEKEKKNYELTTSFYEDTLEFNILRTDAKTADSNEKYIIKNYYKIQPLLRFVKNTNNDDNYDLIKILYQDFDTVVSKIALDMNLEKLFVIELIKIQNLYDGKTLDQDKLMTYFKSFGNSSKKKNTSDDREKLRIKTKYQDQLFKLTGFFGDVLVAKNEQELANVIDSHALPPTSYKLKRRVKSSIDLNGYVGLQASRLITNGNTSLKQQYTAGITAPIGFAFTWTSSKDSKPCNFGFTLDLVDLGNIVNHYVVSSNEEYPKELHFSEVFSPAFSGIYSINNSPFVAFASIKFLPLKTTRSNEGQIINNKTFDATLLSIGVKIDIPLVNLWTKTK